MTDGLHMLDMMSLSPAQLRIIRILLRASSMTLSQITGAVQRMPEQQRLTQLELIKVLGSLYTADWLTVSGLGDDRTYHLNLGRASTRVQAAQALEDIRDQVEKHYQQRLKSLTTPGATPAINANTASNDAAKLLSIMEPRADTTNRRGGKRTLPQSIWDKLEGTPEDQSQKSADSASSDTPRDDKSRKTGKDLLSLF